MYEFGSQKKKGDWGERILDTYLSRTFHLVSADMKLQRKGIDRVATPLVGGRRIYLEYKTDFKADQSGRAFVETISSDRRSGGAGWALKSRADFLIYYLPYSGRVYITAISRMRDCLELWRERYHEFQAVRNQGYNTHGLLVPLFEIVFISEVVRIAPQAPPRWGGSGSKKLTLKGSRDDRKRTTNPICPA